MPPRRRAAAFAAALAACMTSLPAALGAGSAAFDYGDPDAQWPGTCATGRRQSPISIDAAATVGSDGRRPAGAPSILSAAAKALAPLSFSGDCALSSSAAVFDVPGNHATRFAQPTLGCTVRNPVFGTAAAAPGEAAEYRFLQLHLHAASEHAFARLRAPLEAHAVFRATDGSGQLLVIGAMVASDAGAAAGEAAGAAGATRGRRLTDALDIIATAGERRSGGPPAAALDGLLLPELLLTGVASSAGSAGGSVAALNTSSAAYFTYSGSLTTPPCSEVVRWIVVAGVLETTRDVPAVFERHMRANAETVNSPRRRRRRRAAPLEDRFVWIPNARPTQPLHGRVALRFDAAAGAAAPATGATAAEARARTADDVRRAAIIAGASAGAGGVVLTALCAGLAYLWLSRNRGGAPPADAASRAPDATAKPAGA